MRNTFSHEADQFKPVERRLKFLSLLSTRRAWKDLCLGNNNIFIFLPLCLWAHQSMNNRHLDIWSPLTKFSSLLPCQEIHPTEQQGTKSVKRSAQDQSNKDKIHKVLSLRSCYVDPKNRFWLLLVWTTSLSVLSGFEGGNMVLIYIHLC